MNIMEKALELYKKRVPYVLATVVESTGSAPGKTGFKLLYTQEAESFGTVGGGLVEAKVMEEAKKSLIVKENSTVEYNLTPHELGMSCGGSMKVFLEVFLPSNRLIICGGGHVGVEIAKYSAILKMDTILMEERQYLATAERFPHVTKIVVKEGYKNAFEEIEIDEYTYIVIVTKGHETDQFVLEEVLNSRAAYIGMMGSRRKKQELMKSMEKKGFPQNLLNRVYCPIGLDLGGDNPEEIALAIMAEVVAVKNKASGGFLFNA